MESFLSTYTFKVDAKLRVSIPSDYRAVLTKMGSDAILAFPWFHDDSVRCCPVQLIDTVKRGRDPMESFRDTKPSLELLAARRSVRIVPDSDGRIVLPREFISHTGITDTALFIGCLGHFEIWSPEKYAVKELELLKAVTP